MGLVSSTPSIGAGDRTRRARRARTLKRRYRSIDAFVAIVMRDDRAPLLPERRGDAFGTSGSGRDGEPSTRESRASRASARTVMSRARACANAVRETVRDVIGACEAEEVCETRTRRVRVATASLAIGALALCGVGSASTTVGTVPATMANGNGGVRAFAALGDGSPGDWAKDLVDETELDLRELDFGEYARGARVADPDETGGLAKRWATEYQDVMQAETTYNPKFSGMTPKTHFPGHARRAKVGEEKHPRSEKEERAPAAESNENVESPEPEPVEKAEVNLAPTFSESADATESFLGEIIGEVAAKHPKQYADAPDLGHKDKEELSIDDLLIDADDAFQAGSKSHSSSSKARSSSSKPGSSKSSVSKSSKSSKSHSGSISKGSSKSKLKAPEHEKSKSPFDKLKSMVFNEMSFGKKSKNSKFENALNAHHGRMSSRGLSSKGRGKLRQYPYPHHKHDIDENDANDVEVFYKKKDLLDLGEYDQETIDDFKYGRGLAPRDDSQHLHGIAVDTHADVSTYDGDNKYPGGYPGGRYPGSSNGEVDMDSLMASLSVSAKDAEKHAAERRKDQKTNSKSKKSATLKKTSTPLKGIDWSEDSKSSKKSKTSKSASKAKKSTGGALSRDDWSEKAPVAKSKAKSHKTAGKIKSISWSDSPAPEKKSTSTSASKKKKSTSSSAESKTKVGKMSRETAAKYLSKVKGHNEETHRKLRRTVPKLGAVEMEEDDLYDEPIAESSSLGGHSRRHETIAKVVEAATVQHDESEIAQQAPDLGKKHSVHFTPASPEEVRRGGAWRDVFSKMVGGRKSYEKIRQQIFGNGN